VQFVIDEENWKLFQVVHTVNTSWRVLGRDMFRMLWSGRVWIVEAIKSTIWLINSSLFSGSMRASGAPCQFIWFLPEIYQVC